MVAALLLLQLFYGVSDREAERRSRFDMSWKAALGLPLEHRGIAHVVLVEFRARLVRAGMESFLGDRVKIAAKRAGVIGHRRTMDSTGVADSVLTQDTITLIRSGVRRCVGVLGGIDAGAAAELAGLLSRDDYDRGAKPQIMWADPCARAALVAELFGDAETVIGFCARFGDPDLGAAVELLRVVAGQDIEIAADDGAQTPRIAQRVAPGRVISTVDPDARHGTVGDEPDWPQGRPLRIPALSKWSDTRVSHRPWSPTNHPRSSNSTIAEPHDPGVPVIWVPLAAGSRDHHAEHPRPTHPEPPTRQPRSTNNTHHTPIGLELEADRAAEERHERTCLGAPCGDLRGKLGFECDVVIKITHGNEALALEIGDHGVVGGPVPR